MKRCCNASYATVLIRMIASLKLAIWKKAWLLANERMHQDSGFRTLLLWAYEQYKARNPVQRFGPLNCKMKFKHPHPFVRHESYNECLCRFTILLNSIHMFIPWLKNYHNPYWFQFTNPWLQIAQSLLRLSQFRIYREKEAGNGSHQRLSIWHMFCINILQQYMVINSI